MTKFNKISDEELMQLYQQDNLEAFEQLYARFSKLLYGYIQSTVPNHQDTDDIFQKTIIKLDRYKQNYKAQYKFNSWLYTICKNVKRDFYRKEKNLTLFKEKFQIELYIELDLLEQKFNSVEDYHFYDSLGEIEKKLLKLKFNEDYTYDEIAKKLEISTSNARKITSRAVKKLREKEGGR